MPNRKNFPKGSKVKLIMCNTPGCKCADRYIVGEDALVVSVTRKHVTVECVAKYANLMTRSILFSRANTAEHMELIELPVTSKSPPATAEHSDIATGPEQYKLSLTTT